MVAGLVRANEIGRLRIQGGRDEAVALRLRLRQLLGSANLTPPGMAPTAVLIVRHLSDPLPGRLAARRAVSAAWEEAARRRLAALYRLAVRPVQGVVPTRATAVYFSDEAEMLACLALALSRGSTGDWWWQLVRRRLPGGRADALPHLLAGQPRLLPAVCYHLVIWGQSTAVLAKLTPEQSQTCLTRLAQAHDLPAPHSWQQAAAAVGQRGQAESDSVESRQLSPRPGLAPPPWTGWLPADRLPAHLGLERRSLLAIALSLHRRPTAVYSQTFWQKMGHWWRAEKLAIDGQRAVPARVEAEPNRSAFGPVTAAAERPISTAVSTLQPDGQNAVQTGGRQPEARPDSPATAATAAEINLPDVVPTGTPTGNREAAAAAETPPPDPQRLAADRDPAAWPAGVLTRIGGLFYLINVIQRLDIPGCYEADWDLASQIGGWGVLELLARSLLGPAQPHLADDPVWAALAEIDGRAVGELPGEGYAVIGERLLASPLLAGLNPALGGWLAVALPPVRDYLQQVLQLSDPAEIGPRLLLVNGRLHVSATHIDLVLGLEAIALPVRLAGLDINPGWVPALGRVIQFHFQEAI
jgi:hypothetical protein